MSTYPTDQPTLKALIDRKVRPLGAEARVVRASQRRAWVAICRAAQAPTAIRDAVSWAADRTDKLSPDSGGPSS